MFWQDLWSSDTMATEAIGVGNTGKHPHLLDGCRKWALKRSENPPPRDCGVPEAKKGEVSIVLGSTLGKRAREG